MNRIFLKPGDTIRCRDSNDMVETMHALADEDIDVDLLYEKDGEKVIGCWLQGISIARSRNRLLRTRGT